MSAPPPESEGMTMVELRELTGLTYRQLDYWTRAGYLHHHHGPRRRPRRYPPAEVTVALRMAKLIGAGVEVSIAHKIALGEVTEAARLLRALFEVLGEQRPEAL